MLPVGEGTVEVSFANGAIDFTRIRLVTGTRAIHSSKARSALRSGEDCCANRLDSANAKYLFRSRSDERCAKSRAGRGLGANRIRARCARLRCPYCVKKR